MSTAKTVFLANACKAKWLTRKSTDKDIVVRNLLRDHLGDVTADRMVITMVGTVGLAGELVPFGGKTQVPPAASKPRRVPPMPANKSMKRKDGRLREL